MVNGKVTQNALVEAEADFARVPVIHPLGLGVVHGLPRVLVLQFKGKDGDAVQDQHHVHTFVGVSAVEPLAVTGGMVLGILRGSRLVQGGFGPEIADPEGDAAMLEAVAQHGDKPVHVAGVVERSAELPDCIDLVGVLKPRPFFRLGSLDEADQGIDIQPQLRVISICAFDITTRRGQERCFDIRFKAFFIGFIDCHILPPNAI